MKSYSDIRSAINNITTQLEQTNGAAHAHSILVGILTATVSQALETLSEHDPKKADQLLSILINTAGKYGK